MGYNIYVNNKIEVFLMDKIGEFLYEQVYLFFLRDDSNDIVMNYINLGLNLLFNSDSLLITNGDNSYSITIVIKSEKKRTNKRSFFQSHRRQRFHPTMSAAPLRDVPPFHHVK